MHRACCDFLFNATAVPLVQLLPQIPFRVVVRNPPKTVGPKEKDERLGVVTKRLWEHVSGSICETEVFTGKAEQLTQLQIWGSLTVKLEAGGARLRQSCLLTHR